MEYAGIISHLLKTLENALIHATSMNQTNRKNNSVPVSNCEGCEWSKYKMQSVKDKISGYMFLIDSGAEISVIQFASVHKLTPSTFQEQET